MIGSSAGPSTGLQLSNHRQTSTIMPSFHRSFDRPDGMSRDDYVRLLHAKLNAEGVDK